VAIFFAAVVALVDIEIGGGPTDIVFVGAAIGTGVNVIGHDQTSSIIRIAEQTGGFTGDQLTP
jgi:hypothetical protein